MMSKSRSVIGGKVRLIAKVDEKEYEIMKVVRDFLAREGIISRNSDSEFIRYALKHVCNDLNEKVKA